MSSRRRNLLARFVWTFFLHEGLNHDYISFPCCVTFFAMGYIVSFLYIRWPLTRCYGPFTRASFHIAIVILAYVIKSRQPMCQDIRLWFAAVCPRRSRQLKTYSTMSISRHKIARINSPLIRCCFVKHFFSWGYMADTFTYVSRELLDDVLRVVWFGVDVCRVIVRFFIGFVDSCLKIKCDIQEVNLFDVGFDCYFPVIIFKSFWWYFS